MRDPDARAVVERAPDVTYALVQDFAGASQAAYDRLSAVGGEEAPSGLILHAAGPTDGGIRVIDVWESRAAYEAFQLERPQLPSGAAAAGPWAGPGSEELEVHHLLGPPPRRHLPPG